MPCMASAVPPDNPAHSVFGKQIKVEKWRIANINI
jgi:hypothetical protein